jgi:hypothetical protein
MVECSASSSSLPLLASVIEPSKHRNQPTLPYPAKLFSIIEGEIETFHDKKKN